jgi:MFS family permease
MEDEQSATYTVDDALVSSGFGKYQMLILTYAGIGLIAEAMEMMLLSFVGPSVQLEWNLTAHQESMITSVVFVGELIGAYSWGVISDHYGRRQVYSLLSCNFVAQLPHDHILHSWSFLACYKPTFFHWKLLLIFSYRWLLTVTNSELAKQHH